MNRGSTLYKVCRSEIAKSQCSSARVPLGKFLFANWKFEKIFNDLSQLSFKKCSFAKASTVLVSVQLLSLEEEPKEKFHRETRQLMGVVATRALVRNRFLSNNEIYSVTSSALVENYRFPFSRFRRRTLSVESLIVLTRGATQLPKRVCFWLSQLWSFPNGKNKVAPKTSAPEGQKSWCSIMWPSSAVSWGVELCGSAIY